MTKTIFLGIMAATLLYAGSMFGQLIAEPRVVTKTVHDTQVVTKKVEVEIKVMPQSCRDLIATAEKILSTGRAFDESANGMLDIMSRLRVAVAQQNGNEANVIETDLRQLNARLISANRTQVENSGMFHDELKQCYKEAP